MPRHFCCSSPSNKLEMAFGGWERERRNVRRAARRQAAKPNHPGTRAGEGDRRLHLSVCYLGLEELKPGDAQQSEMGIRGLPGEPGTGAKPSYLPARVVLPILQLSYRLVLFLPRPETVLLCLPLSTSTPCVLCPGQGDLPAHLSPREAEGHPLVPAILPVQRAELLLPSGGRAAWLRPQFALIVSLKKGTTSQASLLANAVHRG